MFIENFDLKKLHPADYNPRKLSRDAFVRLIESIKTIGVLKPIISTKNGTIIAGHQRTKAMKELGIDSAPCYILDKVEFTDEIRFNQLHNASDQEISDGVLRIPPQEKTGWMTINPKDISGDMLIEGGAKRNEILRLLIKYGEWGASIVTKSGEIIVSKQYAICCKILNVPLRVFVVSDDMKKSVLFYFTQDYGVFSYDHLPKTTYAQSLAQMFRLRNAENGKSRTYENLIIPTIAGRKDLRILDFGAGQKDYVKMLSKQGFNIIGVEFYFRKLGSMQLDLKQVYQDIDILCKKLESEGLFDMVVCDSVLNSVDSLQAENDVLTCINAFCKPGGVVIFSGRERESEEYRDEGLRKYTRTRQRGVQFIDENGFTAIYSSGVWRYQKFHTLDQVKDLTRKYVSTDFEVWNSSGENITNKTTGQKYTRSWQVRSKKNVDLSLENVLESMKREFNLPYPKGNSVGRDKEIVKSFLKAIEKK